MQFSESETVETLNADGQGAVVLLCEHASHHIPAALNGLGLDAQARQSHIAWDPRTPAVSLAVSDALDAPLVASRMSRLVYDCNRPPDAPSAMPDRSELTDIPGNQSLSAQDRDARINGVYLPFGKAVSTLLEARKAQGLATALVTIHSFTPVYFGQPRAVEIGILHDSDTRLADAMLTQAPALAHRKILRNAPYGPEDGVTHTLALHGIANGLPNVMLELRNDLIADAAGQAQLSAEVLTLLRPALAALAAGAHDHA